MLVCVPIVVAGSLSARLWSETIVYFALTAGAWVVADSSRGMPWLAVNARLSRRMNPPKRANVAFVRPLDPEWSLWR